jgi:hypothetical protein
VGIQGLLPTTYHGENQMQHMQHTLAHGRRVVIRIAGAGLIATALSGGVANAQDPRPSPESGTTMVTATGPQGGTVVSGGTVVVGGGMVQAGTGVVRVGPGDCASWQMVTVGPDGATQQQGGGDATCAQGGPILMGPFGQGGVVVGGSIGQGVPGSVTVVGDAGRLVTVAAVNGSTVSLVTKDGWTKDVDTTNVVITLDVATKTAADLAVGDTVQVDQTRNANDTYTITGLELVLPQVVGVVGTLGSDSFTVAQMDGTTTTVHVSDTTKWPMAMSGAGATGLSNLKTGDFVTAQGKLEADGSMDASSVTSGSMMISSELGGPGMMVAPPIPAPAASPAPSPKG